MENRVGKYGSVKNAAYAPNQYSTWNNAQASSVAESNYKNNKQTIDSIVNGFVSNPDNNYGFSSYYNPSIADPKWGPSMDYKTNIGPHLFGNLKEYGPNSYMHGPSIAKFGQLQQFEDDRVNRVGFTPSPTFNPKESVYGLNQKAQDAYRSLDWYSGPKGVVGPKEKSISEDRTDRSSSVDKSSGSMAEGRRAERGSYSGAFSGTKSSGFSEDRSDRASKVDKSGGFGSNFGGISEDRSDRSSKVDKSSSSGFGSMADARNSDRGSVSGYSGSGKSSSSGKSKGSQSRSDGWT